MVSQSRSGGAEEVVPKFVESAISDAVEEDDVAHQPPGITENNESREIPEENHGN